jgi:hypothetical protein
MANVFKGMRHQQRQVPQCTQLRLTQHLLHIVSPRGRLRLNRPHCALSSAALPVHVKLTALHKESTATACIRCKRWHQLPRRCARHGTVARLLQPMGLQPCHMVAPLLLMVHTVRHDDRPSVMMTGAQLAAAHCECEWHKLHPMFNLSTAGSDCRNCCWQSLPVTVTARTEHKTRERLQ